MISSKRKTASGRGANTHRAMIDLAGAFGSPQDVLHDSRLRRREKIEILSRWAYDSAELSVAEEEGMDDGEATDMSEILKALDEIAIVDVQHCADQARRIPRRATQAPRPLPRSVGTIPA